MSTTATYIILLHTQNDPSTVFSRLRFDASKFVSKKTEVSKVHIWYSTNMWIDIAYPNFIEGYHDLLFRNTAIEYNLMIRCEINYSGGNTLEYQELNRILVESLKWGQEIIMLYEYECILYYQKSGEGYINENERAQSELRELGFQRECQKALLSDL